MMTPLHACFFFLQKNVSVNRAGCWYLSQTERHLFTNQTHSHYRACLLAWSCLEEVSQADGAETCLTDIPSFTRHRAGLARSELEGQSV